MKKCFLFIFLLVAFASNAQVELENKIKENAVKTSKNYVFETLVDLEATPVKNQANTGTCWSFAGVSYVESEILRNGGERLDLSEMFVVRMVYVEKAKKYVRLHGKINFSQGGEAPDIFYVIKKYGAMPEVAYSGLVNGAEKHNHSALSKELKVYVDSIIKQKIIDPNWLEAFNFILDKHLGELPIEFEFEGKKYTARTFADEEVKLRPDDYVVLTSFIHEPFYESFILQIPDNWTWAGAFNLPLEEMIDVLDSSILKGYTVAWATDVSEKGFSHSNGLAIVPDQEWDDMSKKEKRRVFEGPHAEREISAEMRQTGYDDYSTQDDHGMHFTGIVRDQEGNKFYIVKNSWGDRDNPYRNGYLYASESFVKYKTISLLMHKDAIQSSTRERLSL